MSKITYADMSMLAKYRSVISGDTLGEAWQVLLRIPNEDIVDQIENAKVYWQTRIGHDPHFVCCHERKKYAASFVELGEGRPG